MSSRRELSFLLWRTVSWMTCCLCLNLCFFIDELEFYFWRSFLLSSATFSSSKIVLVTREWDKGCRPWPIAWVPPPNSTSVWMLILRKPSGFWRRISDYFRKLDLILLFFICSIIFLFYDCKLENPLVFASWIGSRSTDTSKLSLTAF